MDKDELISWLNIDGSINIKIPNEIFNDLNTVNFKNFSHKCFAYAYYYLITYLYRNAIYGDNNKDYSQKKIISVFVSNNTSVSYITKKDGILDQLGYTKTTNNYPVAYYFDNEILEFCYINELKKYIPNMKTKHRPRFIIKEPVKGFIRFDGEDCTGTFYDHQNTHEIDINKFIKIITDKQLGHVGLFIFGYLTMMCDRFSKGYCISNKTLSEIVGCTEKTLTKYINRLEETGLIKSKRKIVDFKMLEKIFKIA